MSFNALNIVPFVETGFRFESYEAGEKTKPLIVRLAEILDQLEPQGMDQTELLADTHPMPAKGVLRPYEAVCCMGDCLAGRGKGVQKS